VKCQDSSIATCKQQLSSECTTKCQDTGAIFCNGSYVSAGDVQGCIDALNDILTTKISATITASGTNTCTGNNCSGTGTTTSKFSCASAPSSGPDGLLGLGALGLGFAGAAFRRVRRSKRR
jgi:hypothetical protein